MEEMYLDDLLIEEGLAYGGLPFGVALVVQYRMLVIFTAYEIINI